MDENRQTTLPKKTLISQHHNRQSQQQNNEGYFQTKENNLITLKQWLLNTEQLNKQIKERDLCNLTD